MVRVEIRSGCGDQLVGGDQVVGGDPHGWCAVWAPSSKFYHVDSERKVKQ